MPKQPDKKKRRAARRGTSRHAAPPAEQQPQVASPRAAARRRTDRVRSLESELVATQRERQRLVEQLTSTNEELMAANEEVLTMNEELRSANEELMTLNDQLQENVRGLTATNDDLANLLVSTDVATVFLDTDLHVKRFTAAASPVLNLRSSDIGRPLDHIVPNLVNVDLAAVARTLLDHPVPIDRELLGRDGRQFMVRALPYRTKNGGIEGVVLTFLDISKLKQSGRDLEVARAQVAEDLRRMTRMHALGLELLEAGDVHALLNDVLRAGVDITGADMGNIQMMNEEGALTITVHVGFEQAFLEYFARVDPHTGSVCAQAAKALARVVVDDIDASPLLAGSPPATALVTAGVRAMQSTPLVGTAGRLLGMLSTHYRVPHVFDDGERRWLDLLATRAASMIERAQLEQQLLGAKADLERQVVERTHSLENALDTVKRAQDELRSSHEQLQQRTEQLGRMASDLTLTEQRAREQFAKLVHDDIQQLLFSAKLRVDRLAAVKSPPGIDGTAALDKARDELNQAIAAARSLSVELFPLTLHRDGLGAGLSWLADWMRDKYGLTVDVKADPRAELEQKDRRTLVFESVRELLFNVVKHSKVTRATVDLALTADGRTQVTITDKGVGFDPAAIDTKRLAGWGLLSIRERLTLLGGSLEIESAPRRGARFILALPRVDSAAARAQAEGSTAPRP